MKTHVPGLTFPVEKVEVMDLVQGSTVASTKNGITHAIVNMEKDEILSFVSEDYALIKNTDIIDAFEKFFGERDIKVEMQTWAYNDVKFKISFSLLDYIEPIQPNDLVFPQFYILNSYNRTQRYLFGMSVLRQVCGNGLTAWVQEDVINMLHTPGADDGIATKESLELIQDFLPAFEETLEPYYELVERTFLDIGDMDIRIDEVAEEVKFPVKLIEDAKFQAIAEVTKNGWEPSDWLVYNALNYQLNHNAENLLGRKSDKLDRKVLDYLMNY